MSAWQSGLFLYYPASPCACALCCAVLSRSRSQGRTARSMLGSLWLHRALQGAGSASAWFLQGFGSKFSAWQLTRLGVVLVVLWGEG